MRINAVQNSCNFKMLQVRSNGYLLNDRKLMACEKQLAKTKFIDVVLDSHGIALKDKMTDILYRIQSFSLFPQEKAVGIRMHGEAEPVFKFDYGTISEAKNAWEELKNCSSLTFIEEYTKVALWLEKKLDN